MRELNIPTCSSHPADPNRALLCTAAGWATWAMGFSPLQVLDLSQNLISGGLPAQWGADGTHLRGSLQELNLARNVLSGALPTGRCMTCGASVCEIEE